MAGRIIVKKSHDDAYWNAGQIARDRLLQFDINQIQIVTCF